VVTDRQEWRWIAAWRNHQLKRSTLADDPWNTEFLAPLRYQAATIRSIADRHGKVAESVIRRVKQGKSVFLIGAAGVGKTHAACCMLRYAALRHVCYRSANRKGLLYRPVSSCAAYVTAGHLAHRLQSLFQDNSEDISVGLLLGRYAGLPVLAIDDLTMVTPTPSLANFMREMINCRYNNMDQTIITSNLGYNALSDVYGDPLTSRLAQMCGPELDFGTHDNRLEAEHAD